MRVSVVAVDKLEVGDMTAVIVENAPLMAELDAAASPDTDEVGLTIEDTIEDALADWLNPEEEEDVDEARVMLDCRTLEVDKEPETRRLAEKDTREADGEGGDEEAGGAGEDDGASEEELVDCDTLKRSEELVPVVALNVILPRTLLLLAGEDDGDEVTTLGSNDEELIDDGAEGALDRMLDEEPEVPLDKELAEEALASEDDTLGEEERADEEVETEGF
jgi:hypothetical protein